VRVRNLRKEQRAHEEGSVLGPMSRRLQGWHWLEVMKSQGPTGYGPQSGKTSYLWASLAGRIFSLFGKVQHKSVLLGSFLPPVSLLHL
jgi:hypothetical protein